MLFGDFYILWVSGISRFLCVSGFLDVWYFRCFLCCVTVVSVLGL